MSLVSRQVTCASCGKRIGDSETIEYEVLIDQVVRYVVVHLFCTTRGLGEQSMGGG